jgi:hypothetical protein
MTSQTVWRLVGVAGMLLGLWMFLWGIAHINEPAMPSGTLFVETRYDTSRQLESLFGGIALAVLSYLAFRHGSKDSKT